jgi:ELWxxDGT repeat protein
VSFPAPIVLDGIAYFRGIPRGQSSEEVWRSDGTPAGTYPITSAGPAMRVTALTALEGKLYFFTEVVNADVQTAVSTLWQSDGTPAGTAEVYQLDRRYYSSLTTVGDRMFFVAWLPDTGMDLYVSDGTQAGTRPLTSAIEAKDFVELGDEVFFLFGDQIWKTDGTPEGTRALLLPGNPVEIDPDLAVYGGRLYFTGLDIVDPETPVSVPALFRSDGTTAGTVRLRTFDKEDPNVFPETPLPHFATAAGTLFFVAHDKAHGTELWKTDGTAAGTVLVRDVRPGPASSRIATTAGAGDRVFFSADDGPHGVELWVSDGTPSGTRLAAEVAEGPRSSFPREIVRIGNRVFFSADDGAAGREPWVLPLDSILFGRIIP